MFRTVCFVLAVVVSVAAAVVPGSASVLVNGDFSAGLTGWTISGDVEETGGRAVMVDDLQSNWAMLEQTFVMPTCAQSLVFSYTLGATPDETSAADWYDFFTASLFDSVGSPILASPGVNDYFFHENTGNIEYDPAIVNFSDSAGHWGNTVSLDLSGVSAGTEARLELRLKTADDGFTTQVEIDDVYLQTGDGCEVPEPVSIVVWAAVFGAFGAAMAVRRRRRR